MGEASKRENDVKTVHRKAQTHLLVGSRDGHFVVELQVAHKGLVQDVLHAFLVALDCLDELLVVHLQGYAQVTTATWTERGRERMEDEGRKATFLPCRRKFLMAGTDSMTSRGTMRRMRLVRWDSFSSCV